MLRYFPSCKFTAARPEVSMRVKEYMASRGAAVMGCCRPGREEVSPGDLAVTICESCNIIISEGRPEAGMMSLSQFIDQDDAFVFPDYEGERITVQDCFRSRTRPEERAAVRSLLKKMGFEVVEVPFKDPADEEAVRTFDGEFLYAPMSPDNLKLAPAGFSKIAERIVPLPEEERHERMREYCARFGTEKVCCFCNSCLKGLETGLGPGRAFHIAELLFR
ncbi:MAG: hypothetical protein IJK25_08775 [Firmicutes bacterium]|nr:hypothetical protein [Bacillota bacterium]